MSLLDLRPFVTRSNCNILQSSAVHSKFGSKRGRFSFLQQVEQGTYAKAVSTRSKVERERYRLERNELSTPHTAEFRSSYITLPPLERHEGVFTNLITVVGHKFNFP